VRNGRIPLLMVVGTALLIPRAPHAQKPKPASTTWRTPWSYAGARGPEHWGDLDPQYAPCRDGKAQSPIDIGRTQKADLPSLRFEYHSGPLNVINNGYTALRVDYIHSGDVLVVGNQRYELIQFHFHRPSEETIHGKRYDMVLHLMHAASDGKVAGVAILLNAGHANPTIEKLWQYMPETAGTLQEIAGVDIDPATLLPTDTAYYTYEGSQTAPPCSEGVTWFVMKTPMQISAEEVHAFAKLYPHDVRPLQPLNRRVVKESQ
jgi:carbonic anhydrase